MTKFLNNADIKGYIAQTAVTSYLLKADSTGRLVAAIAGTDYQAPTTALLPAGGTAGQILAKIDGTNYNTQWIDNYTPQVKHDVKLGAALSKGTPVYVSSANGTNMIVSAASNASEATSSKTLGLLESGGILNDTVKVITEGLLAGLDTSTATAGDPVWLGPNGTLLFGLANKPVAPVHMVSIGIVTRVQSVNGEIFVKVQNGFELDELHNVALSSSANNEGLFYDSATSLWKNKTIAAVIGYTPANDSAVVHLAGTETITGVKTFSSVINASTLSLNGGTLAGNNIVSMRSNPTGGQFRIEKSDGSLSAYPFYIGVDGTALAYYYNAAGALKVLLHTDGTSYFGNSLSVGYSTYAATSYSLDINGSAQITSTLQVGGNLYGVGATFSNAVTAASIIKSGGTSSQFLKADGSVDSNAYITSSSLSSYLPLTGGTLTGDLTLSGTNPRLYFTDTDNNPDYFISNTDGTFTVYDVTNSVGRFKIYSGGNAEFSANVSINGDQKFQINGYNSATAFITSNVGYNSNYNGIGIYSNPTNANSLPAWYLDLGGLDGVTNNPDAFSILRKPSGGSLAKLLAVLSSGQLRLNTYTTSTSYSGTAAGYLAFDSSGNVITVAGVAATDNTKLPLTGGALTGPLTITGNGSYLGDWGYKTLELNDTSGYAGIFFKNGANIWITRRNGADNAMDWAYSTNATAQGTGTFTQKMRLASDEWWVSTYPNYKMRVVGGDVLETLNGTSVTTLYLQYHSNTGGNVNIAASKFIFDNANNRLNFAKTSGTLIAHGSMTDAIGYNPSYGTYIGSPVGGTYYIYANGQMNNNGSIVNLLHSGNYSSYALPLSGGVMTGSLVNNTDGAVLMESNASENNNWLWKENAKSWGLFWFNRGSQSGQTIGSYTTIGAELMFMGGGSGIAMPTGWTGYQSGSNIAAMISNYTGYIYSASTIYAASEMRTSVFRFNNSSNNAYLTGNSDWGFRVINDNGYIQFGPANNGWTHIYSDKNFYFNQNLYVNGTQVVTNSGTWSINISGNAASASAVAWSNVSSKPAGWLDTTNLISDNTPGDTVNWVPSGFYQNYAGAGNPTGTWFNYINVRHGNPGNAHGFQLGMSYYDNNLWFRSYQGSGSAQSWARALSSQNYNSYSPTLTGGGASGTWGISVTGSAGSLSNMNISQFTNNSGYITSSGNTSGYASYLPTSYAGGVQSNPQVYFNYSIGLKVAMTGHWSVWSDTMWVNGYAGGDVPWMCALHFLRNSEPRFAISAQTRDSGSYGTVYEVITSYNIANQTVSTANNLSGFDKTNPSFGAVYSSNWFRAYGDCGLYTQDYGGHFRRNTYSYGTWETFGYNKNGYGGIVVNNNYVTAQMHNSSGDYGFLTENGNWWNLFYNNGNNCWGIGTDNTYSGDGFRCIKYGSAQYGWTTWSDRRAKENISTITGALDKVLNMRGVYFNYIIDEAKNKRVGFIAQELQQALPEAVRYAEEIDEYNVEYGQIVSVLAEAVKEHYAKTVAQQIEIEALKTQLQTLLN